MEEKSGRPIEDAVMFALISMHLEGNKLDAESLPQVTSFSLGTLMQLPITEEVRKHLRVLAERYCVCRDS